MNKYDSGAQSPPAVVGEVQPFDPGPSVAAAADALAQQGSPFALIGGLALDAWGIPLATKDADFAVPVGAAEKAADALRAPSTEVRPLRIGGVGVRDTSRAIRIDLVDRRFEIDARRILQREELRYADARAIVEQHLGAASANRLDALAREAGRPEVPRVRLYKNGEESET